MHNCLALTWWRTHIKCRTRRRTTKKHNLYRIRRCTVQLTYGKYSHITSIHVQWQRHATDEWNRRRRAQCVFYMCKTFLAVILLLLFVLFTRLSSCCCGDFLPTRVCICVLKALFTQNNKWQMHIITEMSKKGQRARERETLGILFSFMSVSIVGTQTACACESIVVHWMDGIVVNGT